MLSDSVEKLPPEQLVQLLDIDAPPHWNAVDAAAALRQQLAAPLLPDLASAPGARVEHLETLAAGTASFLAALIAPPNVELLHAIKLWARQVRGDRATPLAPGPATLFYYAALAAAMVHFKVRITSLSDAQLREGFRWAAGYSGAELLSPLFKAAEAKV